MLAPQFTLRRLLAWVTLSAFVCLIAAAAARGGMVAAAVLVALFGLVVMLVIHALLWGLVMVVSSVRDRRAQARLKAALKTAGEA